VALYNDSQTLRLILVVRLFLLVRVLILINGGYLRFLVWEKKTLGEF
jgi:hypothetical protein